MTRENDKLTIYYDGACPLCTLEIDHYKRQRGAETLRFVDASDPETDLGPDLDRHAALARFHIRDAQGSLVSGARGFTQIWAQLPAWQWAARLARVPGVTASLELGYRIFLPIRPFLSRIAGRLRQG